MNKINILNTLSLVPTSKVTEFNIPYHGNVLGKIDIEFINDGKDKKVTCGMNPKSKNYKLRFFNSAPTWTVASRDIKIGNINGNDLYINYNTNQLNHSMYVIVLTAYVIEDA